MEILGNRIRQNRCMDRNDLPQSFSAFNDKVDADYLPQYPIKFSGLHIPKHHGSITAATRNQVTVRRKGQRGHGEIVTLERTSRLAGGDIPNNYRSIIPTTRQ